MTANRLSRPDWLSAAVLWLATVVVFGAGAGRLGFYADDSACLVSPGLADSAQSLWAAMRGTMPGRNLHPLWHFLLSKVVADPADHLPALHGVQSAAEGLLAAAFFLLLRLLDVPGHAGVIAAAWFAFWPVHGETHFWLESLPNNLSALLAIVFAATSLALVRGRCGWWLWAVDAAAFLGALFTYDQVFLVLLLPAALRVAAIPKWRFALAQLPYLGAAGFWVWLRLTRGGPTPPSPSGILQTLLANARYTFRSSFGGAALAQVTPLYTKVTSLDWALALLAAAALAALALWLLLAQPASPHPALIRPRHLLTLALLFYVAAYLPGWLWSISPRHHYLPSVGLFAAAAVGLVWIFDRSGPRAARVFLVLALAAPTFAWAAAGRGESRFWEQAFSAKREMFAELKPDLEGKEILVLEDFPYYLGPALLISPHDARFGPQLLYGESRVVSPALHGSISSVPAPGGMFLYTHHFDGPESFRYFRNPHSLVVRFTSWENGRLKYEKNPARSLPYAFISNRTNPTHAPFAVHQLSARRQGDDTIVLLNLTAPVQPRAYLTVVFSYAHGAGFYRWSRLDREGNAIFLPVLLSDPASEPHAAGFEFGQTLRLDSFPQTDRIQAEFYQAGPDDAPVLTGRSEAVVAP